MYQQLAFLFNFSKIKELKSGLDGHQRESNICCLNHIDRELQIILTIFKDNDWLLGRNNIAALINGCFLLWSIMATVLRNWYLVTSLRLKNIYFLAKSLSWVTICPSVIPTHGNLTKVKGPKVSLLQIWLEDTSTWFIVRHKGTGVGQIGTKVGSTQNKKFRYKLIRTEVNYRSFLCKRFLHSVWNPGSTLTGWVRLQNSNSLKWYNSHLVLTKRIN